MELIHGSATCKEIKEYIATKYNANISSLYIAQVKKKADIDKRE